MALNYPPISGIFRDLLASKSDVGEEEEDIGFIKSLKLKYAEWRARTPDLNVVWRDSFKAIDGFFGSATAVSFVYTRWIFLHNLGIFVLWLGLVMVRFLIRVQLLCNYDSGPVAHHLRLECVVSFLSLYLGGRS